MDTKIAVVTGGNRGIGLEICRQLGRLGIQVILTARSVGRGTAAAGALQAEGLPVHFHPLDVADQMAVRRLAKTLADDYGRTDILVNNAAVYLDPGLSIAEMDLALVRQTMETNFYGPLRLCQIIAPLMRRNSYGRIVNLSSQMGSLRHMGAGALAYRVSKTALNALTRVLAAELRGNNILVNSVDPGWVRTEMGGDHAPRSVEEGAETAVWLATLPDGGPTGSFFRDRRPVEW
ncbi:MAG: SDR family oxidoreductase [Chloroflexi bacterium]|nr:SDR family oxidoreductase [Chloroflexota bacterium]MCI0578748.1 SDR family oxidoreductase [Chloroflexota bacterium]MCI0643967.1 SDR family oxidoreductase [Chloroflexota bacterium]MCI0732034.1 SDR family oxidoreductase [Chloroflexota bacterium]